MTQEDKPAPAEPLFELDRKVCAAFEPYRRSWPVRSIHFVGQLGDQAQIRMLSGAVIALGLVRQDPRMAGAGARMLLAHELATFAKNRIKRRIDRRRPRSAEQADEQRPRRGQHHGKEDTSFPSGHSAGAMAAASAVAAVYPAHRGKALAAGAALGVAQVPTGAHYPSDVAAGLMIGAVAERVSRLAWQAAAALLPRLR
jgi:undecaprenyl-diphosphatase